MAIKTHTRESVPFRVRTADGDTVELTYSSPRPAATHDEHAVLETLPWFEPGKPLRNYMLHETDFYDEVEQIWGRRWGAEGIGTLREVLVSRPTENEIRPEYAEEWQYYYSSASGNADLGRLQAQFDAYYEVLEANGVRVNYIEPPVPAIGAYGWIKNLVTLAGGGLVVHGGAILHRVRPRLVAARPRGDLGEDARGAAGADLPDDPRPGHLRAGRGPLARREDVRLQRVGRRERGGPPPARVRARERRRRARSSATAPAGTTRPATATIGTSHMDMVMLTVDHGKVLLAPHLVNYGFVRELLKRDYTIIEVPVEEYWDLALNGVTLEPGKVVMNAGSPTVVKALERHGVEVIQVDFSESHRFAIAGLHCATLELVRDQDPD